MSGIVLSASVRQNLLSLQSTAELLATTQERLSTGKKVNSALENPTNFFTSAALDSRASDISNLLDGIGNGVQVLQAANTGITSLQKLVDTAKSIANQALQTTVGYSTLSNVSTTIGGAIASDLRGTTAYSSATATSNILYNGTAGGSTPAVGGSTLGATAGLFTGATTTDIGAANITTGTLIYGAAGSLTTFANTKFLDGDTFTVNGRTITIKSAATPAAAAVPSGSGVSGNVVNDGAGNSTIYLNAATNVGDVLNAIDLASGAQTTTNTAGSAALSGGGSSIAAGKVTLKSSTGSDLVLTGKADDLKALGLTLSTGPGNATVNANRTTTAASLGTLITDGSTLTVDGKIITFKDAPTPLAANVPSGSGVIGNLVTDGGGNSTVYLRSGLVSDVLNAIDLATGVQTASNAAGVATLTNTGPNNSSVSANGALKISTGIGNDLNITGTGNTLAALGLNGNTGTSTTFTAARTSVAGGVNGKTLTFTSFNGGVPVNVTFGDGSNGTVKTLDQLNAALQANNLNATLNSGGVLTISAANDFASSTLGSAAAGGVIGGTLITSIPITAATGPVPDLVAQATRANLVSQYNNILQQIDTTSQDASYNGINLLNGDQLKLTFNETGTSVLNIAGATLNVAGLGLSTLKSGVDFIDNNATNKVLRSLNGSSSSLRSQASTLGSNLSIVQVRQDFAKNLINVLQTGSSNLTIADTNEEAANSQALSTRQSIAVSALALANQSQQSVLQLLR